MKLIELFEQQVKEETANDQLFEMANLGKEDHGIQDVVIWVGKANKRHGLRVKVSNTKNKMNENDTFVIQMPSLDYNPSSVAKWITPKILQQIFEWIKLNQRQLYDYEQGKIQLTRDFLNQISKVK